MVNTTTATTDKEDTNAEKLASSTALENYDYIVRNKEVQEVENTEVDADFIHNGDQVGSSRTLRSR